MHWSDVPHGTSTLQRSAPVWPSKQKTVKLALTPCTHATAVAPSALSAKRGHGTARFTFEHAPVRL